MVLPPIMNAALAVGATERTYGLFNSSPDFTFMYFRASIRTLRIWLLPVPASPVINTWYGIFWSPKHDSRSIISSNILRCCAFKPFINARKFSMLVVLVNCLTDWSCFWPCCFIHVLWSAWSIIFLTSNIFVVSSYSGSWSMSSSFVSPRCFSRSSSNLEIPSIFSNLALFVSIVDLCVSYNFSTSCSCISLISLRKGRKRIRRALLRSSSTSNFKK